MAREKIFDKLVYPDFFFHIKKNGTAILLLTSLVACRKEIVQSPPPAYQTVPITVAINQSQRGYSISSDFQGLSYETGILTESPDFLNENNAVLIQLIKNLGHGILRIGGNRSDEVNWAGDAELADTARNSLTTGDIDRLSAFAKAIKWQVLFGLNLGNYNVEASSNEALYVHNSLKGYLYALQSGNEPDVFNLRCRPHSYNCDQYLREWNAYFNAARKLAPGTYFAGPDVDPFNPGWLSSFAANEHNNVRLIDGHYYDTGPSSNPSINYHDLLKVNKKLESYLVQLNKISSTYHLPYRISECNSVWGGGKPGVSNVFASSLWALDFMWAVAENKGQGINFHGGNPRFAYTPITIENGVVTARPEYYAMLAFKQGSTGGTILPATISDARDYNNCSVYACTKADNTYSVTLINKEDTKNFSFTVQLSKTATTVKIARLTAPDMTSTTGVTFAGSAVNSDGTFTPAPGEQYSVNGKSFIVYVPAGSAAVVTVQ